MPRTSAQKALVSWKTSGFYDGVLVGFTLGVGFGVCRWNPGGVYIGAGENAGCGVSWMVRNGCGVATTSPRAEITTDAPVRARKTVPAPSVTSCPLRSIW